MTQTVDVDAIKEARKERNRERYRAWKAANSERVLETKRAWYVANRAKARESSRAWYARRAASDPVLYKRERMLSSAKDRSRLKNLAFDITIDDISAPITCPVLGIELNWNNGVRANNSPSLDRVVPELGYVRGNVMVISDRANTIKNNATPDELRRVADFYAALVTNVNDTKEDSNDTEN